MQDGSRFLNTSGVKDDTKRENYYHLQQWQAEHEDGDDEDTRAQESFLAFLRVNRAVQRFD